jgi:membrane protease YdiL (CAAX protease family)
MNFIQKSQKEDSPYLQLFMLTLFAFAGAVICIIIGFLICFALYGMAIIKMPQAFLSGDPAFLNGLKIIQICTTIGLFLVPAVFLAYYEKKKLYKFYGFKKPQMGLLLTILLLMVVSMPVMEWIAVLNQKMTLPVFLKPIEDWMKQKENEAAEMTVLLLTVRSTGDFILNLFMIALLPAVAEEFLFRGALQRSFGLMFKSHHLAIWLAAFIFSTIHLQFFGFFPRLFLGAAFGYLYYWSGSLWYSMLAHFLNNAYAVCVALYMQKHHIPLNNTDQTIDVKWYGYVISVVLSIVVFQYFKNKTTKINGYKLD